MTGETDTADNSKSTTVAVKAGAAHIGDLDAVSTKLTRGQWNAVVTIAVHDPTHNGGWGSGGVRQIQPR